MDEVVILLSLNMVEVLCDLPISYFSVYVVATVLKGSF